MHPFIVQKQEAFRVCLDHLNKELSGLRTGRAHPSMVENISVKAYDSFMDLKSIASIHVPDAKTLTIEPWDKSLLTAVEKAIREADLGLNPVVDGSLVRLNLPSMTEENRRQLVKVMKEKSEETRVSLRGIREGLRDEVMQMEKDKAIAEDEKFKILEELDKMTKDFTAQVDELAKRKEDEIMTV